MSYIPNHFETLNVSRNASPEEIKASYNVLTRMFSADELMMTELKLAYEVLGDSTMKTHYERQLFEEMNRRAAKSVFPVDIPELPPVINAKPAKKAVVVNLAEFSSRQRAGLEKLQNDSFSKFLPIACCLAIVVSVLHLCVSNSEALSRLGLLDLTEMLSTPSYTRPVAAPNGQPFPETSAYITGYEVQKNDGKSSLEVKNSSNDNDVYLKLITVEGEKLTVARHVYIKGGSDFKLESLAPGKYEVQYLDLVAGKAGRSVVFEVTEKVTITSIEASRLTITLKTAVEGKLRVEPVPVEIFNSIASL